MGLSGSIPFLIQQKVQATEAILSGAVGGGGGSTPSAAAVAAASKLAYKANAIFALCSWPFSLKLLWAPIVDACFIPLFGRRKSWLVPCQALAGLLMVSGANFVERQLGLDSATSALSHTQTINVQGVTLFFFGLYFLMATQDIACDGWALTMLSKKNRGRGPVCNSIGQNIGYFLSFVGFLAFNDPEACETIWRPLLGLTSRPGTGLVSLGGFIRSMGYFMLATTLAVALFKHEKSTTRRTTFNKQSISSLEDDDAELDASQIGVKETYHRLWAVCQLPAVRSLFLLLLTYRLPTALSDNVKFLKAVEYGLSKSTTALLSPTVILPLGILVPILATKIWHGRALRQFMTGYNIRVTLVPLLDLWMLHVVKQSAHHRRGLIFWIAVVASTAFQAIVSSLQFNAQMTFFATRVDPLIGGSYMTLLNTFANLGGTYPASLVMWLIGAFSKDPVCTPVSPGSEALICSGGRDPFVPMQFIFMAAGLLWVALFSRKVQWLERLPDEAWRTHLSDDSTTVAGRKNQFLNSVDVELGGDAGTTEPLIANSITRKDR
jgi:PAT family acetyl-CoA transporter-like MFS transporter 1